MLLLSRERQKYTQLHFKQHREDEEAWGMQGPGKVTTVVNKHPGNDQEYVSMHIIAQGTYALASHSAYH